MRYLPDAAREPGRKLRGCRHQLAEGGRRKLPLQGMERCLGLLWSEPGKRSHRLTGRPMRHGELPARSVAKLDDLLAEAHLPGASRRQVDGSDRHLRRKPETVRGGRTAGDDDLTALTGESFDRLFHRRRSGAEPAGDRQQINTAPGSEQLAAFSQT